MPMMSALTKALLNDEQYEPGATCYTRRAASFPRIRATRSALARSTPSISRDCSHLRDGARQREMAGSTRADSLQPPPKPTSPAASQSRGSPAPRKRVVRLSSTLRRGTLQSGSQRSVSTSTQTIGAESRDVSMEGGSQFQTEAEMDQRHQARACSNKHPRQSQCAQSGFQLVHQVALPSISGRIAMPAHRRSLLPRSGPKLMWAAHHYTTTQAREGISFGVRHV